MLIKRSSQKRKKRHTIKIRKCHCTVHTHAHAPNTKCACVAQSRVRNSCNLIGRENAAVRATNNKTKYIHKCVTHTLMKNALDIINNIIYRSFSPLLLLFFFVVWSFSRKIFSCPGYSYCKWLQTWNVDERKLSIIFIITMRASAFDVRERRSNTALYLRSLKYSYCSLMVDNSVVSPCPLIC